ncbi:hypothetical protein [Flavobacterium hibernum]|uniref:Uncharacterized protein n=1 Tax=Flavobacterium hibernum TaxID=37752 RepID=A0A0D0EEV6_9FLAO|nr:hypothetical protein [Flavobacterium hibernum]KIO53019.1 hypothetical protein IW18_10895 [Flavobacterium hibernum]OXA91304.1 hypothetical protein B0A73_01350 [Flavobacterium hibernum]STO15195.1 Uncharacterised protein [Flavobacterium hibernum]
MKLFNFFRRKEISEIQHENCIYFHEDLFNQVEFLPRENLSYLKTENKQIEYFGEENSDALGFKDIYMRKDNPITLADKKITLDKLNKILTYYEFKKYSEVYEGYGSAKYKCENTFAYTYDGAEIFVSIKNDFVNDFWINNFRFHEDSETKTKLRNLLSKIGNEIDLILNDWDLATIIDLKDELEIQKYLDEEL